MSRQIRHDEPQCNTPDPVETTLGEVRRANLNGRLYPHPRNTSKRRALRVLRSAGLVERVPASWSSLGGWFARGADSATLRV
jgi:hypothetical protein